MATVLILLLNVLPPDLLVLVGQTFISVFFVRRFTILTAFSQNLLSPTEPNVV